MNGVGRFISNIGDRSEDEIVCAEPTPNGMAAYALGARSASHAYGYTTDVAAGEPSMAVFDGEGYRDPITYVNAFRLIEDVID